MKIAVVSGASSGIGRELVKIIDKRCPMLDEIWVIARRKERLEKLQYQVRRPLRILDMDLSKKENLYKLKALMDRKAPKICVMAASAGLGKYGKNTAQDFDDVMAMVDVNVRGLTALTQMCLPYMAKGGRMLLLSSSAAFLPQPGFGIYAATKAYVLSYARSLAAEVRKKKIYVTAVCPGPVDTEFFQVSGGRRGTILSAAKLLCMAKPEKVARHAWHDVMRGERISVYGLSMKSFRVAAKVLPHKYLLKIMEWLV